MILMMLEQIYNGLYENHVNYESLTEVIINLDQKIQLQMLN